MGVLQFNSYSCGVVSIINALSAFEFDVPPYDEIKRLAGTTYRGGTSRNGIIRAVTDLGFVATPYHSRIGDNVWKWIKRHAPNSSIIALVDNQTHWVCISGVIGDKVILVDGSPNKGENGVSIIGKKNTIERMNHLGHYYSIRIDRL